MSDLVAQGLAPKDRNKLSYGSLDHLAQQLAFALAEVEKLHYARSVETHHGKYDICDYDKTLWPCRTHKILNPEEG